jgi:dehydrogenase/reductase SDR family protein 12
MGMLTQFITSTQFYLFGRSRFTQTGWQKAAKKYVQGELEECKLQGKCYAVTGANSGIGRETAGFLASRGARVLMLCRSKERAEKARDEMKPDNGGSLEVIVADVSLVSSVKAAAEQVRATTSKLDGLVCCAGVLLNEKTMTSENVETTFASHLAFGSCLLTKELLPLLRATPNSRVVYTSSGGMYNSKFPGVAACVDPEKYDGQFAYVYAKRGQVLLAERLAAQEPRVAFVSSHPGWTRTAAVEAAYGSSAKYLEPMRTAWQGAEGQCWLCVVDRDRLENGGFYLDRAPQRKHLAGPFFTGGSATKNSLEEAEQMVRDLDALALKAGGAARAEGVVLEK